MADTNSASPRSNTTMYLVLGVALGLVVGLIIGVIAYLSTQNDNSPEVPVGDTPSSGPTTPSAEPTTDPDVPTETVTVYFSKSPESDDDPTAVYPVAREMEGDNQITAAMLAYIDGPTAEERAMGFYSEFELTGESNCDGGYFTYSTTTDKITLQFCRTAMGIGSMGDGRMLETIKRTLSEAAGKEPVVLDKDGNCLFDMSGMNVCKE